MAYRTQHTTHGTRRTAHSTQHTCHRMVSRPPPMGDYKKRLYNDMQDEAMPLARWQDRAVPLTRWQDEAMPLAGRTKPCHSLDGRTKPCHSRAGRSHATRVSRSSADAEQPQLSPRPKQPQGVQAASHLRPRPRPSKAYRHSSAWGRATRRAAPRRGTRTSARALATAGSRIATTYPSGSSSFRGAGPPTPARPGLS